LFRVVPVEPELLELLLWVELRMPESWEVEPPPSEESME